MLPGPAPHVDPGTDRLAKWPGMVKPPTLALLFFPLRPVGGHFSRNGTICCLSAKSPAGSGIKACLQKTFSQVFATIPGPLFRRPHGSVRVLMRIRETVFAATASGSSSATSSCVMDVASGFYHKEVMSGVVHPCPALRVDSRWVSNWHTERKSSRTQQSEI